jgi:peroxiredoxin
MAKAYDMFAGEEPYNCSKRGTVVVGKDGRITYYHEHPMREARKVGDLSMAVAADVADEQRANEGGSAVR